MIANFLQKFLKTQCDKRIIWVSVFLFVFGLFLTAIPVFASGNTPAPALMDGMSDVRSWTPTPNMNPIVRFIEVDNETLFTPIDVSLDILGVLIILTAFFIVIKSIREYGRSTIGIAILYFLNAIMILGTIRLIFILDDDNILHVKDVAEMTAWHILFFYAILLFYLAGLTLTKLVSTNTERSSYKNALYFFIFSALLSIIFLVSYSQPVVQNFLQVNLQNTWFNTFGWFHIIALFMSGGIAIYLYRVRSKFKGYSGLIGSMHIALFLLASIHLWELLNETWRVIVVSNDFGEFFERILWIPVFVFILQSFIRLRKMSAPQTSSSSSSLSLVTSSSSIRETSETVIPHQSDKKEVYNP